jgi:pimeloyl-ACP methyl ester carboxylesterase
MRKFLLILLSLGALVIGGFMGIRDADIPYETLVEHYGQAPSQYLELPSGLTAHYRDQGNPQGPVLLLLHGSNASLYTWEPWAQSELAVSHRIISVDLIGHGLSSLSPQHDYSQAAYETFVEEFVGAMGLETFALAGNSMGGGIAWRYALTHADQLTALILVDASGIPRPRVEGEERQVALVYRIAAMPVLNQLLLHILPRSMVKEQLLDAVAKDQIITEEMVTRYHAFLLREGRRAATLARMNDGPEASPVERLGEIETPTLILWGAQDTWVPVHGAHVYAGKIPDSTLILYEGVGHMPMEEVAHKSAADVAVFLAASLKALAPRHGSE